ncbi:MAG: sulfotransferase [Anaerolineales bacterium]|nr:sulfotransferase [Anaerolineales bacterium]
MSLQNRSKIFAKLWSKKVKQPNCFIAGAPRCGTSALYRYLSEHPKVFMPEVKELNYFAEDFPNVQKIAFKSYEDYLKVFEKADENHIAIGDASPFYLFSTVAFEKMAEAIPDAKIIISLRNPVDFIHSYHRLNLSLLREDETDLEKAWNLQALRAQGKNLPTNTREPKLLMYGEVGLFGKYIENLYRFFPREQVKIILLDDLTTNTKAVYEYILDFLDVPSDGRTEFPRVNANFENKSRFLAKLFHPPLGSYRLFMKAISPFGVKFTKRVFLLYNYLERLNTTETSRVEMSAGFRAQLTAYFRADVEKLEKLIDRDLSIWQNKGT